jgi:hypothetical protein
VNKTFFNGASYCFSREASCDTTTGTTDTISGYTAKFEESVYFNGNITIVDQVTSNITLQNGNWLRLNNTRYGSCVTSMEGVLVYNGTLHKALICNGTVWNALW